MKEIIYNGELEIILSLLEEEERKMMDKIKEYEKLTKGDKTNFSQSYYIYRDKIYEIEKKIKRVLKAEKTQYEIIDEEQKEEEKFDYGSDIFIEYDVLQDGTKNAIENIQNEIDKLKSCMLATKINIDKLR